MTKVDEGENELNVRKENEETGLLKADVKGAISIYDIYTKRKKYTILAVVAMCGFVLSFCDTVFLPALIDIEKEFAASPDLVAATLSIYLFSVGVFGLFWGPFGDKFGRRVTLLISFSLFSVVTVACFFSPNITLLLLFRGFQGVALGGDTPSGQAVISDTFPPKERGFAFGLFTIPLLLGPILGPVVGGVFSQIFGWRSTFIVLMVMGFLSFLSIVFLLPETQQYLVLNKIGSLAYGKNIIEKDKIAAPKFVSPLKPLLFLTESNIISHVLLRSVSLMVVFVSMVQLPLVLELPPYNFSDVMIGVSCLPIGAGMLSGSIIFGKLSDKAFAKFKVPESRFFYSCIFGWMTPTSMALFGWSLEYELHLGISLTAGFFVGMGMATFTPSVAAYITSIKQSQAASASALMLFLNFSVSGIGISVSVYITSVFGVGLLATIVASIYTFLLIIECVIVYKKIAAR